MRLRLDTALPSIGFPIIEHGTEYGHYSSEFGTEEQQTSVGETGGSTIVDKIIPNTEPPGGQTAAADRVTHRQTGTAYLRILALGPPSEYRLSAMDQVLRDRLAEKIDRTGYTSGC